MQGGPVWRFPSFVIHHISSLCNQNNSSKAELPSSISVRDQLSIRCQHDLSCRFKIVHMNCLVVQAPFLLSGYKDEYKLFTSDEFMAIVADVEEQFDIKFLGFAENGFRQFATVDHPITCVADLKGLKMRVINTNLLTNYMSALGANPTQLAYTEIYSGLQNKVIDGEEVNISSCASQKHYDVINYISVANMYCFPATYWMSGKTYRSISEEDFNLIKGAFMDGADRCFDSVERQGAGKKQISTLVCAEANAYMRTGNMEEHDRLVLEAAKSIKDTDLIILSQYSITHLKAQMENICGCKVIGSGEYCIQEIARILGEEVAFGCND